MTARASGRSQAGCPSAGQIDQRGRVVQRRAGLQRLERDRAVHAPVSRYGISSAAASFRAAVDLPEPAGPSMVMIIVHSRRRV